MKNDDLFSLTRTCILYALPVIDTAKLTHSYIQVNKQMYTVWSKIETRPGNTVTRGHKTEL